jgi:hypothetical protein
VVSGAIDKYKDLLEAHGVAYLHKPIERKELFGLIENKLVGLGQPIPPMAPVNVIPPMDGG